MKQMSTLKLGNGIYEINDATARKLITELSKNLDNVKVVDGKSAYEIAVENGFVGSETDWLTSLKGEKGDTGNGISTITKKSTVSNIDTYTITFTNGNTIDYNVTNGADGVGISDISYKETDSNGNYIYTITLTDNSSYDIIVPKGDIGIQGIQGEVGEIPSISMTAEVDNTVGTPSVTVTKSGTDENPFFNLAFSNLKGETGSQGEQGVQGEQGLSAYQVAVQNGYSGTESEWLESLKGEEYDDTPIWKVQGEFGAKNLLVYPYAKVQKYTVAAGVKFELDYENQGCIILNTVTENTATYTHRELYASTLPKQLILPKGEYIFSDGIDDSDTEQVGQEYTAMVIRFTDLVNGGFIQERPTYYGRRERPFTVTEEQEQLQRDGQLVLNVRVYTNPSKGRVENLRVKPMIRYASDTDSTWRPYVYTNDKLTHVFENEISRNLIPYPYYSGMSYITSGITCSSNTDGEVELNGTTDSYAVYNFSRENVNLDKGIYILSMDFSEEVSQLQVQFGYFNENNSFVLKGACYYSNPTEQVNIDDSYNGKLSIRVAVVNSGVTLENVKISNIMLRKADIIDDTWKPYEMTNKQLTDAIISNGEEIANESTVSQELKPNYFHLFTNAVESLTITLPSNRRPWNEFNFAFTTSSSGCNLALPSAVTWMGDTPTLDADTYYEVSIKNDRAVIG